jgi:hypothetical protein
LVDVLQAVRDIELPLASERERDRLTPTRRGERGDQCRSSEHAKDGDAHEDLLLYVS